LFDAKKALFRPGVTLHTARSTVIDGPRSLCSPASISLKKVWFLSTIFVSLLFLQIPVQKED
jgi:hypothetical protein